MPVSYTDWHFYVHEYKDIRGRAKQDARAEDERYSAVPRMAKSAYVYEYKAAFLFPTKAKYRHPCWQHTR